MGAAPGTPPGVAAPLAQLCQTEPGPQPWRGSAPRADLRPCPLRLQLVACAGLLALLRGRCRLRPVGPAALAACRPFLRPTGLLTLRTLAISTTFAMATSLAARTGATHAAAHQICFQARLLLRCSMAGRHSRSHPEQRPHGHTRPWKQSGPTLLRRTPALRHRRSG